MKTFADPEAQAEIDRLRAELTDLKQTYLDGLVALRDETDAETHKLRLELDRLRKVLLAEWEKDRKTYAALMEKLGDETSERGEVG